MVKSEMSYSNFKYSQVSSVCKKSCQKGDLETASRWLVEMMLSKWSHLWWEDAILFCASHIHVENPKIPCFLNKILQENPSIFVASTDLKDTFFLVLGVCCYSPKGIALPSLRIQLSDYELKNGLQTLQNNSVLHDALDPFLSEFNRFPVLLSLLSVFIGHLTKLNCNQSVRILSWILFIEKHKEHKHVLPVLKSSTDLDPKDWIMVLWKVMIVLAEDDKKSIISAWSRLYVALFKNNSSIYTTKRTKYMPLFLASVCVFTEHTLKNVQCIQNFSSIQKAITNSSVMFEYVVQEKNKKIINSSLGFEF